MITLKELHPLGWGKNSLYVRLFCLGEPAKTAVALFHGLRTDSREFGDFPADLAALGHLVLTLDFSGHGRSSGLPGHICAQSHRWDAFVALDCLREKPPVDIVVVGHSFGARAALVAALEREDVKAAVLIAPQYRSGAGLVGARRLAFALFSRYARFIPSYMKRVAIPMSPNYAANFTDFRAAAWAESVAWDPGYIRLSTLAYAASMDNTVLARKLSKPVLVIACGKDKKAPPASAKRLFESFQSVHKTFALLPHSGHSPFQDVDRGMLLHLVSQFVGDKMFQMGLGR